MKKIGDYSFGEIPEAYYNVGKKHAIAKANREMLDESKKSLLAKEMSLVAIPEGVKDSESYRERIARQNNGYREFVKTLQDAIQTELELKYEMDSLSMLFDFYRSMNSLEKAKTNIL